MTAVNVTRGEDTNGQLGKTQVPAYPAAQVRIRRPRWVLLLVAAGIAVFVFLGLKGARPFQSAPVLGCCATFEFRVTDATTGEPIEGASINRFHPDRPPSPFGLQTKEDGRASIASECFTDGESILYPDWTFTVSAPGYQTSAPVRLTAYTGVRGKSGYTLIEIRLTRNPNVRPE